MTADESLQRFGLVPSDADLPIIRDLLAREADAERSAGEREDDVALLCCVQLFSRGLLEDVLRIWDAQQSGMDLGASLDVQFLCGPGLETTKQFLATQPSEAARRALAHITECEQAGDFEDFSRDQILEDYRDYFGVG